MNAPVRFMVHLAECEHAGDLDQYEREIAGAGGVVVERHTNFEAESARLTVEVRDIDGFAEKFSATDTAGMAGLDDADDLKKRLRAKVKP